MRSGNALTYRLSEGSYPVQFLADLASSMGLTLPQLISGEDRPSTLIWNPIGEQASSFYKRLEPHEAGATTRMGFFRIPNCPCSASHSCTGCTATFSEA